MTYKYINLTILLMNIYQSALSERGDLHYYVSDTAVPVDRAFNSCNLASPPLLPNSDSYMLQINANNVIGSQVVSTLQHKWWVGYYKVQVDFENVGCKYSTGQWNYTYTCLQGIDCELWKCYTHCKSNLIGLRRGNASCTSEVSFCKRGNASCTSEVSFCKNSFCFCLTENSEYDKNAPCDGRFYFAGIYQKVTVLPGKNGNLNHSYGIITDEELNDKTINYKQGYVINTFADNKLMFDLQTAQFPSLCELEPHSRIDRTTANFGSTSAQLDTTDNYGLSQNNSFMNQNRGKDIVMYAGSVAGGVLLIAAIAGVCIWYKRRRGNDDKREKKSFELEDASDSVNEKEIDNISTKESAPQISNHPDIQPTAYLYSTIVKKRNPLDENDYDTTNSNFKIASGATDKTYDRLGEATLDTYDHVGQFHKPDSTREGEIDTYSHVVEIDSAREVQYDEAVAVHRHGRKHFIGNTTSVESNNDGLYDTACVSQLRGDMIDNSDYSHVKQMA